MRPRQQNEILRENQFYNWRIHKGNVVPLAMMLVVVPGIMHHLVKDEFAIRERNAGKPVVDRL